MPMFNLTALVKALILTPDLRARFNQDPEGVMDDYFLTPPERHLLYRMEKPPVSAELYPPVDAQLAGFNIPPGEFGPPGPNCVPDPGIAMPVYPSPTPALFRVRPRHVTSVDLLPVVVGGVTKNYFEASVWGQSFSRNPIPSATITEKGGAHALTIDNSRVFGTMRCSQLVLLVEAPKAAHFGTYLIQVTNCPGTGSPHAIANTLEIEIG